MKHFDENNSFNSLEHYINSIAYKSSDKRTRKLRELKYYLESQRFDNLCVAILGPGSDIEVSILSDIFRIKKNISHLQVYCFDFDLRILEHVRKITEKYQLPSIEFVNSNATNLPMKNGFFNLVISSSLQHEIFSYQGGIIAIQQAVSEYCRILANRGVLFIRDFACPPKSTYALKLKTPAVQRFWLEYYKNWRKRYEEVLNYSYRNDLIVMDSYEAVDFVNHFVVKLQYDTKQLDIATWKEIDERYITLAPEWYINEIEMQGLELILNSHDKEIEQERIIIKHIEVFQIIADQSIVPIPPLCERYNLIFQKY